MRNDNRFQLFTYKSQKEIGRLLTRVTAADTIKKSRDLATKIEEDCAARFLYSLEYGNTQPEKSALRQNESSGTPVSTPTNSTPKKKVSFSSSTGLFLKNEGAEPRGLESRRRSRVVPDGAIAQEITPFNH